MVFCLSFPPHIDALFNFTGCFPESARAPVERTGARVWTSHSNHDQRQRNHHDHQWTWRAGERTKEQYISPYIMQKKISKKSGEIKAISVWKSQGESERQGKASHAQLKFRPRRAEKSAPYFPRWRQTHKNRDLTIRTQLYLGTDGNAPNSRAHGTHTRSGYYCWASSCIRHRHLPLQLSKQLFSQLHRSTNLLHRSAPGTIWLHFYTTPDIWMPCRWCIFMSKGFDRVSHPHSSSISNSTCEAAFDLTGIIQSLNEHLCCTCSKMPNIQFLVLILVIDHSTTD